MRVRVDTEMCAGHARCNAVAGQLFDLDDEGYALPLDRELGEGERDAARTGADACPERAIEVTG